ncbi:hypothetical protein [Rhizobium sp. AG855]|uniref:hypothetical protein n=1 Tax=Rhizobium sp. AG855 TaxID=2183898 RepID=UPI000E74109B|nr:hypothetical protein [Rhizobium sp. AG855]RKE84603.1 hypothetical protein DFO46_1373 [Rhizobium sp. AG855]
MPTSSFTLYQDFKEQLGKGVHNFSSATLKIAFTNTAPNAATHTVLADITQISTAGGYTGGAGGGLALDSVTYIESAGVGALAAIDETFVASGGSVGPFRYVVLYNDTPTSPVDPLIGYWDYGSSITVGDGEQFTLDLGTSIITLT